MTEQWSIDEVVLLRQLDPGHDLTKLTAHIKKNGQKVPILVTSQKILIDGLRRLEVIRNLGDEKINVVVASNFDIVCEMVKKAREHGVDDQTGWERIWEIFRDTRPLVMDSVYLRKTRSAGTSPPGAKSSRTRGALAEAFGLKTVSLLQAVTHVFLAAEKDDSVYGDRAREVLPALKSGEMTPYQADGYIKREPEFSGDVVGIEDQRSLLGSVTNTLSGVAKGIDKLGQLNSGLSQEELTAYLTSLKSSRRKVLRFIRQLEEKVQK